MVTYSKLFLLIDALSKGINDCIRESILAHVQILEALIAAQVSKKGGNGLLIVNRVVFKR